MPLNHKAFQPTHPGRLGVVKQADLRVPEEDGLCSWLPATIAALRSGQFFTCMDMGNRYIAGDWTITTGGTGDAQAQAITKGGGALITFASDDNFDTTLDGALGVPVLASGKRFGFVATLQVSDLDGIGWKVGFTTGGGAAALPFGTNYTDVFGFSKAILAGAVVGTARGNSGTAANSGTLGTMADATEITIGMFGVAHATAPELSFYYGTPGGGGAVTPATSDQLAQLAAHLTTPPTMLFTIHGTGVTGTNPTLTFREVLAGVEV
jgi:hypothetical protein